MHVPQIIEVKDLLNDLKNSGVIAQWELPYENLLTRRSAAIFFVTLSSDAAAAAFTSALEKFENFSFRPNAERKLSQLQLRITFSEEEKVKNGELLTQ